jgi:hypothetical protein
MQFIPERACTLIGAEHFAAVFAWHVKHRAR